MSKVERKNFKHPDETRKVPKGKLDIVRYGGQSITLTTFEPGWKWSESLKPIIKTNSCELRHQVYVIAGGIRVRLDSGPELEFGPGDLALIPPGHDAWVVGKESFVGIDFAGELAGAVAVPKAA